MKVEFLKDGCFAHSEPGRGNFECKKGETMSGLSEVTAKDLKSVKWARILGEDDPEENMDEEDGSGKKDVTIRSDSMKSNPAKPW